VIVLLPAALRPLHHIRHPGPIAKPSPRSCYHRLKLAFVKLAYSLFGECFI